MYLESPADYDYTEAGINQKTIRIPNSNLSQQRSKLKTSRLPHLSKKQIIKIGKIGQQRKPNYFELMYKQVKKKTCINLFVRKMKQTTILKSGVEHQLCQSENWQTQNSMKTVQINQNIQIAYIITEIILTIVCSIATSIALAFPHLGNSIEVNFISLITSVICLFNILLRFFTKSSIDIKYQIKRSSFVKQAIMLSLDYHLFIDLITMLIFFIDYASSFDTMVYFKLIILLKLQPTLSKITNIQIMTISNCFRQQYWALIKVFLFNFLFAHFVAIILILMANQENSWLQIKNLIDRQWFQQYIWSYYWATTIMLTIGFGDIVPQNSQEALIMVFIESLSCVVLAYNINSVGNIIKKIKSYEEQKVSNFKTFTQMQGKQKVSEDLKNKITNYITQSAELKRNFNIEEQKQLLQKLPKSFYQQFKQESSVHIFWSLHFFRNLNFQKLKELALKFQKRLTHPEEIIIESGSVPDVCIINNGSIVYTLNRIGTPQHGRQVQTFSVKENQFKILSLYFFINRQVNYDMKCKGYAIVYSLKKEELEAIISTNRSSYEYYCMIKDKDRFNPNDWQVQKCDLCNNQTHHTIFLCPKLHYIPINQLIIFKALKHHPQKFTISEQKKARPIHLRSIRIPTLKYRKEAQKAHRQFVALSIVKCPIKNRISNQQIMNIQIRYQTEKRLKEANNENSINSNVGQFFREVGEQLKDQIMASAYGDKLFEVDVAHDYASYFHTYNPNLLSKKFSKNRHI